MTVQNYRNYTQELLTAQKRGAVIVCSAMPYEGTQVHYAPRRSRDPQPWTFLENSPSYDGMFRYSGRFCHATWTHYGVDRILCNTRVVDGIQITDNVPDVTCPECRTELRRSV